MADVLNDVVFDDYIINRLAVVAGIDRGDAVVRPVAAGGTVQIKTVDRDVAGLDVQKIVEAVPVSAEDVVMMDSSAA